MKKRIIFLAFLSLFIYANSFAQLVIDNTTASTMTANQFAKYLVDNFFAGEGVEISNIKFIGNHKVAISSFDNGSTTNIGINKGVILSTGKVIDAKGPNNSTTKSTINYTSGYSLLSTMIGKKTEDAAVLEFDFVPICDTIKFKYVFASEEYPVYVGSNYNDGFGFFISGPNPAGGNYTNYNIARIPGTTIPVTINNLNEASYSQYFVKQYSFLGYVGGQPSFNYTGQHISYNGFTKPMYAIAKVVPNQTYKIIIAIADVYDDLYDSGVFLEAGSFSSNIYRVNVVSSVGNTRNAIAGCADAIVSFKLPNKAVNDIVIKYTRSGDAIPGVHYVDIPDSVIIKAGTDSTGVKIVAIENGISTETKYINFEIPVNYCGANITFKAKVGIKDYINMIAEPFKDTILLGDSSSVNIKVAEGNTPYTYSWNTGLVTDTAVYVKPTQTTTYNITIKDACGKTVQTTAVIYVITPCDVNAGVDKTICSGGQVNLSATSTSGGTYSWLNIGVGQTVNVSPTVTTTYTVRLVKNDCTSYDSVIVNVKPLPNANAGADKTIIKGASTTLTATGGGTYKWSTNATTATITVSPTLTTTYTVTVTKDGCTATDAVVVVVQSFTLSAGADQSICLGQSATLTATGADTYKWSTNATTAKITVSPTVTTTYKVTGTKSGATATDDVVVYVNPLPTVNLGTDKSICKGETTSLSVTGSFTVLWSTGATTKTISVSPSITTTYKITATDSKTCSNTDDIVVTVNPIPNANAGTDQTIYTGASTTLTATGGGTYKWSTNATTASINVSPTITTTYTVTVTKNGCTATDAVVVVVQSFTLSAGADQSICLGQSATLTATGADSYKWSTNATTAKITVTPTVTTTYKVTGTKSGATATDDVVVYVNPLPTVNLGADKSICKGETTSLSVTGSFTVLWSTGATTKTISVSPSITTTYKITATDSKTCSNTDDIVVTVNPIPNANAGADQTIYIGASTTLTATGGGTYKWSTNATTATITVSPTLTSTYTVTVTKNGCTATDAVVVVVQSLTVNAGADQSICLGQSATLTATGADSYKWSTNATTAKITVTPTVTTTYKVTGTKSGATATDDVVVYVNPLPTVNLGADKSICKGETTSLSVTGSFTVLWSTGATTKTISVSPSITTTYKITATDSKTCSNTDDIVVTVNPIPNANAGADQTIYKGASTTLTATGGGTYKWSTNATTATITVSPTLTTTYTVTVSKDGCTATDVLVVLVQSLTVNAGADQSICLGQSATLTATGADSYKWNTNATTAKITVTPTVTTTYKVTGTKAGATATDDVVVYVNPLPIVNLGADKSICLGDIQILSVKNSLNAKWSTGETTNTISVKPSITTIYAVTVTNNNGCTASSKVSVIVNPIPTVDAGADKTIYKGATVNLTATGIGNFLWNTGASTSSINVKPNQTSTYVVTITNNNCTASDNVVVIVNELIINVGEDKAICEGNDVVLAVTGADTYQWTASNGLQYVGSNITVKPTQTTTYTITGYKEGGFGTDAVVVIVNKLPYPNLIKDTTITYGDSIEIKANVNADVYIWNVEQTSSSIIVKPAYETTYKVTAIDANYCSASDQVVVNVKNAFYISKITAGRVTCATSFDAYAQVFVVGGYQPLSYLWSNGATTDRATNLGAGTYTVTVTDNLGFKISGSITVKGPGYVAMPNVSTIRITNTTAMLKWTAVPNVTSYLVRYKEVGTYNWTYINANSTQTFASVMYLKQDTEYEWQIRAFVDNSNYSCFTDIIKFKTSKEINCDNIKNPHTTSVSTTRAIVRWEYDTIVDYFFLRYRVKETGNWVYLYVNGNSLAFVLSNLSQNTTYEWQVRAFCLNWAYSDFTPIIEFTTLDNCKTPENTNETNITATSAVLNWNHTSETVYNLVRWREKGTNDWKYANVSKNLIAIGCISCEEKHMLKPMTTYEWQLRSFCNSQGTVFSDFTPIDTFTTNKPRLSISGANTICYGTTTTLTEMCKGSYTWNTGATNASITVSPTENTTYTVTVTVAGVSVTDSKVVYVSSQVNVFAGNDITICAGDSAKLIVIGAKNYEWSPGSLKDNITVMPLRTTTYIVTGVDGNCSATDDVIVFVNPKPFANAGADVFMCSGESTNLIATGGNSYSWSNNVNVEFNNVSPTSTTYYTVTVSNGNCSATDVVVVVVEPFVYNIVNDVEICNGETATLQVNGAANYEWSTGERGKTINVKPATTTEYSVTIRNYSGCSALERIIVTVSNKLNVNAGIDHTICKGERVTLKAEAENPTAFRWSTGSLKQSITVAPIQTTTYIVTVSSGTCSGTDNVIINVVQCKNEDFNNEKLSYNSSDIFINIYPNPITDGNINVSTENIEYPIIITITDATGRTIKSETISSKANTTIGLEDVNKGVYFIRIQNKNFIDTRKIIVN